jgi:hypothetical protein
VVDSVQCGWQHELPIRLVAVSTHLPHADAPVTLMFRDGGVPAMNEFWTQSQHVPNLQGTSSRLGSRKAELRTLASMRLGAMPTEQLTPVSSRTRWRNASPTSAPEKAMM